MAFGYADVRLDFITREGTNLREEAARFDRWFSEEIREAVDLARERTLEGAVRDLTRALDALPNVAPEEAARVHLD